MKLSYMKRMFLLVAALIVCCSCGGQKTKKGAEETTETTVGNATTAAVREYKVPEIPAMMTDPEQRAQWITEHYWDNFNFTDTLGIEGWSAYAEQAFVNFNYHLLDNIPYDMGGEAIATLFSKATANKEVFLKFAEIAEKYLYEPNSPYRDDENYISTLNAVLANPTLDQWERIRPEEQLRMSLKNRVGTPAADFRYTLASGATGTLYGLKAPYTLIYINNPGCPACRETMMQVTSSPFLSRLIDEGTLVVLAIYPDEDLAAWREHASEMPVGWINSYDKALNIKNDELYDLKAIPTLYLLARDKTVMLKDVMSIPLIEDTINNAMQK